jgi:hypothetical protein
MARLEISFHLLRHTKCVLYLVILIYSDMHDGRIDCKSVEYGNLQAGRFLLALQPQ